MDDGNQPEGDGDKAKETSDPIDTPGALDLPTFNLVVSQLEGIYGPLASLDSDDGRRTNVSVYIISASPPHRAEIDVYNGDDPPAKQNYDLICKGRCFISGNLENVAAYRRR